MSEPVVMDVLLLVVEVRHMFVVVVVAGQVAVEEVVANNP